MSEPTVEEMTRVVAEKVMGLRQDSKKMWYIQRGGVHDYTIFNSHFDPATVPADRDALVEEMRKKRYSIKICLTAYPDGGIGIGISKYAPGSAERWYYSGPHGDVGVAVLTAAYKAVLAEKGASQ